MAGLHKRRFAVLLAVVAVIAGLLLLAAAVGGFRQLPASAPSVAIPVATSDPAANAFRDHASGVQMSGAGVVSRMLADDDDGGRHQRFIVRLPSGQTLLVAHNIDLAPRVAGLAVGDTVAFYGVYEYSAEGGVIHWTHRDPDGSHIAGWLKHNGNTYQ